MSLNLEEKKAVVAEVSAQIADAQSVVLAEYHARSQDLTLLPLVEHTLAIGRGCDAEDELCKS